MFIRWCIQLYILANSLSLCSYGQCSDRDSIKFKYSVKPVRCKGSKTGEIIIRTEGAAVVTYSIDREAYVTNGRFQNLEAGNYRVFMKDKAGTDYCIDVTVESASKLEVIQMKRIDETCYDKKDGWVEFVIRGGTPPYSMLMQTSKGPLNALSPSDTILKNLSPDNYKVFVSDSNGCSYEYSFTIGKADKISITCTTQQTTGFDQSDGRIIVNVIGGRAPYMYGLADGELKGENVFQKLPADNYIIYVCDGNKCLAVDDVNVPSSGNCSGASIATSRNNIKENITKQLDKNEQDLKKIRRVYRTAWISATLVGTGGAVAAVLVPPSTGVIVAAVCSGATGIMSTIVANLKLKSEIEIRKEYDIEGHKKLDDFLTKWSDQKIPGNTETMSPEKCKTFNEDIRVLLQGMNELKAKTNLSE